MNKFDKLVVNVPELFKSFPYDAKESPAVNKVPFLQTRLHRIYKNRFLPARYRKALWKIGRNTHIDLSWYEVFREYWKTVLKGRGVWSVQDFFFLKGVYTVASANQSLDNAQAEPEISEGAHLKKWQHPKVIAKLFHMVNKEYVTHQLLPLEFMRTYHPSPRNILEYGCATAPITLSYFEFFNPDPQQKIYLADLEYLPFHYGCYRFRHCQNIIPLLLRPEEGFQLPADIHYDVIFCRAVFEHLDQPLRTAQRFIDLLNPGGILIFDYVMTDLEATLDTPMGLDHHQGHAQRSQVLDLFESQLRLLEGTLHRDKGTGLCVVQKKDY
ncbi:MAG: methyltransferase domain-containing protein [Magnetococcales bacterium]|nr:methyltransferase domain-containing protein [Magnetococcales bacterium]